MQRLTANLPQSVSAPHVTRVSAGERTVRGRTVEWRIEVRSGEACADAKVSAISQVDERLRWRSCRRRALGRSVPRQTAGRRRGASAGCAHYFTPARLSTSWNLRRRWTGGALRRARLRPLSFPRGRSVAHAICSRPRRSGSLATASRLRSSGDRAPRALARGRGTVSTLAQ